MNSIRTNPADLPFAVLNDNRDPLYVEHKGTSADLKSGDPCPNCRSGKVEYNGMLNLECSSCGYTVAGCFT